MAAPLMILGLATLAGLGSGVYVNKTATESPTLEAKIAGLPAVPALGVGGAALALLGGSMLAPVGLGMLVGSLVSADGIRRTKQGLEGIVRGDIANQLPPPMAPAPPALPMPGPVPAFAPAGPPGGGILSMLLPSAG